MYNEQLEQLIDAALADGVLTEKEKQILFKKAQTFGVDLDEFEMVLDARLFKLQKEQQTAAPKSNKLGNVRKCPACGALVSALAVSCAECGWEFSSVEVSPSVQQLSKKIAEIKENASIKKKEIISSKEYGNSAKGKLFSQQEEILCEIDEYAEEQIDSLIENFPVPNAKKDLFDLIMFMKNHPGDPIYKAKYNECLERAKCLFPSDPHFIQLINADKESKTKEKSDVIAYASIGVCGAVAIVVMYFWGIEHDWRIGEWIGGFFFFALIGEIVGFVLGILLKMIYKKYNKVVE